MKKTIRTNLLFLVLAAAITFVLYSCKEDTVTPPPASGPDPNSVNGTVTFVDSNFAQGDGSYLISAYPSTGWPPIGPPSSYDTIRIAKANNKWILSYTYKLVGLSQGDYVITTGYRRITGGVSPVMGVYGCDTSHGPCWLTPPNYATIGQNNEGVAGIDFLSWADTTMRIYP